MDTAVYRENLPQYTLAFDSSDEVPRFFILGFDAVFQLKEEIISCSNISIKMSTSFRELHNSFLSITFSNDIYLRLNTKSVLFC